MRHVNCVIPSFILLLSAAGCNCCYQPGCYPPNGLIYQQPLPGAGLSPLQKPLWLSRQERKHDPQTCPLCNSHASTSPHLIPQTPPGSLPLPVSPDSTVHENGVASPVYDPEGYPVHQPRNDQPVQLNGIVPASYEKSKGSRRNCGCGNHGCSGKCRGRCGHGAHPSAGQCGADRNRGCCGAVRHQQNSDCSCAGAHPVMNHDCGCSGLVSSTGPCVTCDVIEGFPMGGTVIDSGCSTCGTMVGGLTAGSVIPGTVIDGQVISGGVLPGAVTSEGVLFDSSTIDGSVISSGPPAGTCSHCGKSHTDLKPVPGPAVTPVPQAVPPSTEALPGQVNQGTLKPQTPPASVDHPI